MDSLFYHTIVQEFEYRTSTSSGPGGQHVNRSQTRVEIIFNLSASTVLNDYQKSRLREKLHHKLSQQDELILAVQDSRSQFQNKEVGIQRMLKLIIDALKERKKRIPTRPSRAAINRRLENKRRVAEKKGLRARPSIDHS